MSILAVGPMKSGHHKARCTDLRFPNVEFGSGAIAREVVHSSILRERPSVSGIFTLTIVGGISAVRHLVSWYTGE